MERAHKTVAPACLSCRWHVADKRVVADKCAYADGLADDGIRSDGIADNSRSCGAAVSAAKEELEEKARPLALL